MSYFDKVKQYLLDMDYGIVAEDADEQLVVIEKEEEGIKNMIVDCEDPILVIEQFLFQLPANTPASTYRKLLVKNREIVHGAFVLDETGSKVLFRDTLQLESLDKNELEGSISSLSLLLAEYYEDLLSFSKGSVEV